MSLLNLLKTTAALISFVVIILAGWYPFKKKLSCAEHYDFPVGETLATGVFLGAGLLHMLPEASESFNALGYHYPFAFIIAGLVFLLFLWFEHLGRELYQQRNAHPAFALFAWAMFSIHSFITAVALGLNHSVSMIIMLFLAIIAHKWAESFAIAVQLNKSALTTSKSLTFFLIFSLMTPLGIFFGWYFNQISAHHFLIEPIFMAASAGTFLYLGTLHGLERCVMVERCCNLKDFSFVIIGFGLMAMVAEYL